MRLLFLGDSITNGSGGTWNVGYAHLVVAALRHDHHDVVAMNESAAGRTIRDGDRIAHDAAFRAAPDVAVVCFGANDQKLIGWRRRRPAVPVAEYECLLGHVCWLVACAAPACRVLVIPPPPLPPYLHAPYAEAAMCSGYTVVSVSGYRREWLAGDGCHPDDNGHAFIAARVLETIRNHARVVEVGNGHEQSSYAPASALVPCGLVTPA